MPIEFVKGDLLASPKLAAIAHRSRMQLLPVRWVKGIAKVEMRNRWPRMYDEYRSRCHEQQFKLGDVFVWEEGGTTIFNLGTQRSWKTRAELPAIKQSWGPCYDWPSNVASRKIGLPKIGAGLGGLNWAKVKGLLHEIGNHSPICLIVFEQYEPAMRTFAPT